MSIKLDTTPKYEKIQMVLFGILLAGSLFGYGIYALIEGNCALPGRGFPVGTLTTFHGLEGRLLSAIYLGLATYLFANSFLSKLQSRSYGKTLSWLGAIILLFGLSSLVTILSLPLFQS